MLFGSELPRQVRSALRARLGGPARVLTWAQAGESYVVATPGQLIWGAVPDWHLVPWHEIGNGGWDSETNTLRWRSTAGGGEELVLTERGRLPEVFRERVGASVVLEDRQRGQGNVDLIFTARRNLGDPQAPLLWDVVAIDGRTLDRPGLREFSEQRLAQLKSDLEGS